MAWWHQMKEKWWLETISAVNHRKRERYSPFRHAVLQQEAGWDRYGMYKSNLSCALPFSPSAGVREQKEKDKEREREQQFNDKVPIIIIFSIQRLKHTHIYTQRLQCEAAGSCCSAGTQRWHVQLCVIKHCRKARRSSSQQISSKI